MRVFYCLEKSMAILNPEDFENAKIDIDNIGESVNGNETGVVTPRFGDPYPTLPAAIAAVENKGGYITVANLAALNAIVPEFNHQVARTDDNGNEYRWNPAATPSPKWEATGRNSFKIAPSSPAGNVHLNTLTTEAIYFQTVSAYATSGNGYPAHAQNTQSRILVSKQSTVLIQSVEAKGVVATRTSFDNGANWGAFIAGLGQTDLTSINSSISAAANKISKRLEWYVSGAFGQVTYNKSTHVLSWNNPLVAATNAYTSNRINIAAGSVAFSGAAFETLYIDLTAVPTSGTITTSDFAACLKIATYTTPTATFNDNPNQIPIAKLTPQGEIKACAGFVNIISEAPAINGFQYIKTASNLSVFLQAKNGNLIRFNIPHEIVAFDVENPRSQLDLWRIERALEVDPAFNELQEIATWGEIEFTMREKAYPADHVGGTHGDELLTSAFFVVDGVYKPQDFIVSGTQISKEIWLEQISNIYRLNTNTPIAIHKKRLQITDKFLLEHQEVEMLVTTELDRFWTAMLTMRRKSIDEALQITKYDIREGVMRDVSTTAFEKIYTPIKNGSSVLVGGDKYSGSVEISDIVGFLSGADCYVSNDEAYNKIYLSAIGSTSAGVTVEAGKVFGWTTKYSVNAS